MNFTRSLMELLDHHKQMNEMFLGHQEALMGLEWDRAEILLERFRRTIEVHIHFEEAHLLPLYKDRAGERPGAAVTLFVGEHKKIKQFLARFTRQVRSVQDAENPRRALLSLFDQHTMFKHLMEHHDLRERNVLYPCLDEVTTLPERESLFQALSRLTDSPEVQATPPIATSNQGNR